MIDFNIDNYLRISWQDVLLVCISSFIIVVLCKHFFWNKILDFIAKRQALIQSNIDSSEKIKEEAETLKQEYDNKMKQAGTRANEIISNAKDQAEAQKEEILRSAELQAQHIEKAAREEIERDRMKAEAEMKNAIADVAIAAAGQILQSEVDADKQQQVLDDLIERAGEGKW